MAIYHLHVKNISRGDGRSIVAAAAYRAGETLPNEAEERLSEFGGRRDVVHTEIRLPAHAPGWMAERAILWNAVEAAEIRKDARLAKEIEVALPVELSPPARLALARIMADAYTAQGFVVDLAIHDDGVQLNPHAHLLMTTRVITGEGFGGKIRSADGRQFVTEARALWERVANAALNEAGVAVAIDRRSYGRRGLERTPGQHRGPDQEERRARRARAQQEREEMSSRIPDDEDDLQVPDPDGYPIYPEELAAAQDRLLDNMHRPASAAVDRLQGDLQAARAAVDRENAQELSDFDANAYRLTPENRLAWLEEDLTTPEDIKTLERWESRLNWLNLDDDRDAPAQDDHRQEPDPYRR